MKTIEFEISLKYNGGSAYTNYTENHRCLWDCLNSVKSYLKKVMYQQAYNTASVCIMFDGRFYNYFFSLRGNCLVSELDYDTYYPPFAQKTSRHIDADQIIKSLVWKVANEKHLAIEALKKNIEIWKNNSADAKRPLKGNIYLWFCSPAYGQHDPSKQRAMPIEGNERFCETICKLADKYFV